jgi:hypothetical protein
MKAPFILPDKTSPVNEYEKEENPLAAQSALLLFQLDNPELVQNAVSAIPLPHIPTYANNSPTNGHHLHHNNALNKDVLNPNK